MKQKKAWKKLACSLLAAALTAACMPVVSIAAEEEDDVFDDGVCEYTRVDGGVSIIGTVENMTVLNVPDTYEGMPVVSIGEGAFEGLESLEKVHIGKNLEYIDEAAFYYCTALTEVTFAEDSALKTIGDGAFSYCTSLTEIALPDGLLEISDFAFKYDYAMKEISIPDSVTTIGQSAFYYCLYLESAELPASLETLGTAAFTYCISLKELTIPADLQELGDAVFLGCGLEAIHVADGSELFSEKDGVLYSKDGATLIQYPAGNTAVEFSVPEGVTAIAASAFCSAISLERITLPEGCVNMGQAAFMACTNLKEVNLPASMTVIAGEAFSYCTALESIEIPETVTYVGEYAFFGCTGLSEIYVPESVTEIGDYAFGYMDGEEDAETGESPEALMEGFVLDGERDSAAEQYAKDQRVEFAKQGIPWVLIACIAGAVLLVAVLAVVLIRKQKTKGTDPASEAAPETPEQEKAPAEEYYDKNYESIVGNDEDDAE